MKKLTLTFILLAFLLTLCTDSTHAQEVSSFTTTDGETLFYEKVGQGPPR